MRGENGVPETPEWQPHPKPSPFDIRMSDVEQEDPEHIVRGSN